MASSSARKRLFTLLTGLALAIGLAVGPACAKKPGPSDSSDRGGVFQPPTALTKPSLVLDTSVPKVASRQGDQMRQGSPDTAAASALPAKAVVSTKRIDSLRVHSLFE